MKNKENQRKTKKNKDQQGKTKKTERAPKNDFLKWLKKK